MKLSDLTIESIKELFNGLQQRAEDIKNFVSDEENCKFAAASLLNCVAGSLLKDFTNDVKKKLNSKIFFKIENSINSFKILKMNQLRLFLLLSMVAVVSTINAQDIAYGFKAGLNFNRILADAEMDDAGATVETFSGKTGFHVGATFTWKATDLMGLRGELMFSQKGYKRRYEGASYYDVTTDNGTVVNFGSGSRKMFISNANSYIDIPVMGYAKLFKWLEVHVGANIGLLVSSTAVGDFEFSGDSNGSTVDIAYDLNLKDIN